MELFLPGIIVLLLSGFFAFMVIPRVGIIILIIISVLSLIAAGTHHYYMFSSEYTLATWQNGMKSYAPWIVLLFSLFFIIGSLQYIIVTPAQTLGNAVSDSIKNMPSSSSATNPLTSAINTTIKNSPTIKNTLNNKNSSIIKNSPIIPGTGYSASQF